MKSLLLQPSAGCHRPFSVEAARVEASLKASVQLLDQSRDGIFQFDPSSLSLLRVNEAAVALTGYSPEALTAMTVLDLTPECDQPAYRKLLEPLLHGELAAVTLRTLCRRRVGTPLTVEVIIQWLGHTSDSRTMVAVARDITEQVSVEAELRRFRAAIDQASDGIFMVSPDDGRILDCNTSASASVGGSRDAVLQRRLADFDAEVLQRVPWADLAGQLRRDGQMKVETLCRRMDGSTFPVEVGARYIAGAPHDYIVGVMRDITERKAAEQRAAELNASLEQRVRTRTLQLEEAIKDLESFSYSVSHDLRAPLRAIDNFSGFLLEDHAAQLDAEGRRLLRVIRDNTARMGRLINEVLEFSRAGRAAFEPTPIDMAGLVHEVFRELQASGSRAVSFTVGRLPAATGNVAMVRAVLANLLGNALKYTAHRGDTMIEVLGHVEGDENVYEVRDNGVGFDPQYADKLFGLFQRLHGSEFEGTGLGLAIVKRIVSRHGGRVWATSEPDVGATFGFSLPRASPGHARGDAP